LQVGRGDHVAVLLRCGRTTGGVTHPARPIASHRSDPNRPVYPPPDRPCGHRAALSAAETCRTGVRGDRLAPMSDTPSDHQDLTGRVALVTGGSRGIGVAVAAELLRRGAAVTVTGRKQPALDAAAEQLTPIAGADRVLTVAANTGHDEARAAVIATMMDRFGAVDVLVNNTGINPVYGPLMD